MFKRTSEWSQQIFASAVRDVFRNEHALYQNLEKNQTAVPKQRKNTLE